MRAGKTWHHQCQLVLWMVGVRAWCLLRWYDEARALRSTSVRLWGDRWLDVEQYAAVYWETLRCSVRTRDLTLTFGTELPGSWHQQQNRTQRTWCAVVGEFEAR
jgi:hypothetical protein